MLSRSRKRLFGAHIKPSALVKKRPKLTQNNGRLYSILFLYSRSDAEIELCNSLAYFSAYVSAGGFAFLYDRI